MSVSIKKLFQDAAGQGVPPTIDLGWDSLRANVEAFLVAVDEYSANAMAEIKSRVVSHNDGVRDFNAEVEEVTRNIALEKQAEQEMLETLEFEKHTISEITATVNQLQKHLSKVKEQSATLEAELNRLRREVNSDRAEKDRQSKKLDEMRKKDAMEIEELEAAVGLKVTTASPNLLIQYTLIDPADHNREFLLVLDISGENYIATKCSPTLPALGDLVRQLNVDRDIYGFIKKARKAFKALIPGSESGSSRFVSRTPARKEALNGTKPPAKDGEVGNAMAGLQLADK